MNEGFNNEIKHDLNSLSALAVDDSPVEIRLQKLLTNVCKILQVPAAILILTPEFSLLPRVVIGGTDFHQVEKLKLNSIQAESEQCFAEILNNEAFSHASNDSLVYYDASKILGSKCDFLVVPLLAGTQKIGALLLSNPVGEIICEMKARFYIVVEQLCLLLLLFKAGNQESSTLAKITDKDWITEKFLATLSHELRTPLHAILGWANLLQHPSMDKELRSQALKTIEQNARAQNFIINELLDASYSFKKQAPLHKRPVLITSILHHVVKLLRFEAEQKGVLFSINIPDSSDYVMADPERLSQVFWHLLANAIKFTADHGTINLSAQRVNDSFEITLTDSGIGIATGFLPHIFEPFRQEESDTTRSFGGLGLGLSIVRHQIELHGGKIEVKSNGKKQGTKVLVRLPLDLRAARNSDLETKILNENGKTKYQELAGLRALLVDDDADSIEIISSVLRNHQVEVRIAQSAEDAFIKLKDWHPDIFISDLQIQGINGYELMRHLRNYNFKFHQRVATIALTAFSCPADRLKALSAGFQTHLPKPIDPSELLAVATSLVQSEKLALS